jgi:hypothetical protein
MDDPRNAGCAAIILTFAAIVFVTLASADLRELAVVCAVGWSLFKILGR